MGRSHLDDGRKLNGNRTGNARWAWLSHSSIGRSETGRSRHDRHAEQSMRA
jgi:hypothetical protein